VRSKVLSVMARKFKGESNPFLVDALRDKNESIIREALGHLRSSAILDERLIEMITPFLKHPEDEVRLMAVSVLGMGVAGLQNDGLMKDIAHKEYLMNALFEKLENMSNDDSVSVRRQVHSIIVNQFKKKSNPFILEALKDKSELIIQKSHRRAL